MTSADTTITTEQQQKMLEEVLNGLQQPRKRLPSKFFYDERGSELFEQITHLDEYYLTRTERGILQDHMDEISRYMGGNPVIIELGSGSSSKTRLLLDRLDTVAAYLPVDISEEYLHKTVQGLKEEYPGLNIKPVCTDYTQPFSIPDIGVSYGHYVVFYPGSTIGNFEPEQAKRFLEVIAGLLDKDGGLLIGVDLKKDPEILHAAYNDHKGLTAEFNKNILRRLNRELGAGFDLDAFRHKAFYNKEDGRIEMQLVSEKQQEVDIDGHTIRFEEGEAIHTENSYKYSPEDFEELASGRFTVEKVWTDEEGLFSVQYLVVRSEM